MKATLLYDPPIHRLILTPESETEADNLHHFKDSPSPIKTQFRSSGYSEYDVLEITKHKA